MITNYKNHNPHADTEHIHVAVSPSDETATMTDAEKAQLEEEDNMMTRRYLKVWAIVMTVFIIVTFAVFAVSCDRNDPGTEDSNTTTTTTTQVTTTTSDEDDVTTTTRPKDTTTTKATTTAVTTTTSDEEDVTTTTTMATTTTNAQTTTTTTKATTTTPQQTTTVTTINTSANAKLVEVLIRNLGGVPTGNLDSYVANATTIEELHTAIKQYLTDEQLAYTVGNQLITKDMFTWLTDLEGRNSSAIVYRNGVGFALITNVDAEDATFYIDGEFVVSITVADEICNENCEMTPIVMYPN